MAESIQANSFFKNNRISILPLNAKDFNTGRCRLNVHSMKQAGLKLNSAVCIVVKDWKFYCTAWPPCEHCMAQDFVQLDTSVVCNTDNVPAIENLSGYNLKLLTDITPVGVCVAKVVEVVVYMRVDDIQEMSPRLMYDKLRRVSQVRCILQDKVFTKHCWIYVKKIPNYGSVFTQEIDKISVNNVECYNNSNEVCQHASSRISKDTKIVIKSIKRYQPNWHKKNDICLAVYGSIVTEIQDIISSLNTGVCMEQPRGFLLLGPPGVGKTSLVAHLADCWQAELFILNGADVFGAHMGESEKNLRKIFETARETSKHVTCVFFIDEIDALCPKRSQGNDVENRVTSQLLTLIDDITYHSSVVLMAATNRPNSLDPAVRRPGRFDKEFVIGVPSSRQRLEFLRSLTQYLPLSSDVNLELLSKQCLGYVAADLTSLVRHSATSALATTLNKKDTEKNFGLTMSDFQKSFSAIVPSTYRGVDGIVECTPVKWQDIAGYGHVKEALKQAVEWPFLYPESFSRLGLSRPRGILLYGPPGCCKTTLVRAAATSCHCTFLSFSCAQLYSPYVGDAERMIREVFTKARAAAPAILFLDEVDAVVKKRSTDGSSGVEARILSTLLNELDGVGISSDVYETTNSNRTSEQRNILFVAATNRPEVLDEAILRPGRVDRVVYVPHPDRDTRLEILKVFCKKMPVTDDVSPEILADKTQLYSGADLKNLCREAALNALQNLGVEKCSQVEQNHFIEALSAISPSLSQEQVNSYENLALSC